MRDKEKKMLLFYGIMLHFCQNILEYLPLADYIRTVTPEQLYNDPYAQKHFERIWLEDGWLIVAMFLCADPERNRKDPVIYDELVDMYESLV